MSDRPGGWTDDNRDDRYGRGSDSAQPESARVMRHVQRHPAPPPQRPAPPRQYPAPPQQRRPEPPRYADGYDDNAGYDNGYSNGQVYGGGNGGGRGYGGGDGGYVQGLPRRTGAVE